jgi:twitching motility two-component system response regulator PilH
VLAHRDAGLARLLQRHLDGYRVETAASTGEADALARELRASAVLADVDAAEPAAPVGVATLRCPLPRVERLVERLGVVAYLVKPVARETLLRAVRDAGPAIRRVLIVDDDAPFAWLLSRMLASDGAPYRVSTAHGGEEALAAMRADRPDLVLLDLGMPGLDGVGVLGRMAGEPALGSVKVIVVSAHDEGDGSVPLAGELRLSKPAGFQLAELARLIDGVVRALAPARPEPDGAAPGPPAARPA